MDALTQFETAQDANLDLPSFARAEPCAMLIDEVEAIWAPIAESDDRSCFARKLEEISSMRQAYCQA